jgi:hypothetical protein
LQGQGLVEVQPLCAHQTHGIGWKISRHGGDLYTHRVKGVMSRIGPPRCLIRHMMKRS